MDLSRASTRRRIFHTLRVAVALMLLSTCAEIASAELCPEMRESLIGRSEVVSLAERETVVEASDAEPSAGARIDSDRDSSACLDECESCICCCAHLLVVQPFLQPSPAECASARGPMPFQVPATDRAAPYRPPRS